MATLVKHKFIGRGGGTQQPHGAHTGHGLATLGRQYNIKKTITYIYIYMCIYYSGVF